MGFGISVPPPLYRLRCPSQAPTSEPLHLILLAFAGLRCSYLSLSPAPCPQEASHACWLSHLRTLASWLKAELLTTNSLSLLWAPQCPVLTLHGACHPAQHPSPCAVGLLCTLVRSLKAEPVPNSFLILQGLAQGMAHSRCLIKFCEMNE